MPIDALTNASRPWISNGTGEFALDALREMFGVGGLADVMDQEHELVAAEARDRVARAQRGAQPAADLFEQSVAEAVPPAVVDPLEAIEIQEEDGERTAAVTTSATSAHQRHRQPIAEQHPIGQSGQRIVERRGRQALLELLVASDVVRHPEDLARHAVGVDDRPLDGLQPAHPSRGVGDRLLRDHLLAPAVEDLEVVLAEVFDFFGVGIEVGVAPADQRLDRGAVGLGDGAVHQSEATVAILGEDEVGADVEDLAQEVAVRLARPRDFGLQRRAAAAQAFEFVALT